MAGFGGRWHRHLVFDHSPYFFADKVGGAGTPGFNTTTSGVPGLETRLPLLFSEGLLAGRLTLASYLDLTSRNTAAIYGLDHCKGRIAIGLDADLALWDPARNWRLSTPRFIPALTSRPVKAWRQPASQLRWWCAATPIIANETLKASPGFGRFVARRPSDPALAKLAVEDRRHGWTADHRQGMCRAEGTRVNASSNLSRDDRNIG